jgi:ribosome-binding factor A
MTQRTQRIDELLRQEIGQALERELADPGIGFVTVTDVETSPDLSYARVWVSVIGTEQQRRETLAALRRAMPYVRHGLGGKLRLRRIPELDVRLDDSIERGTRVLHLIDQLEAGQLPAVDSSEGETLPTPVRRLPHEGDAEEAPSAGPSQPARRKKKPFRTGSREAGAPRKRGRSGR